MPRKIVQLLNTLTLNKDSSPVTLTMALADDGTAWEFRSPPARWEPLPLLPDGPVPLAAPGPSAPALGGISIVPAQDLSVELATFPVNLSTPSVENP
jgi:hypothetical protein